MLKRITFASLILVMLIPAISVIAQSSGMVQFQLRDIANPSQAINSSQFAGKVTVVEFWKLNCPACEATMRHLSQLYQNYSGQGFAAVGIFPRPNKQSIPREISDHLSRVRPSYPNGIDRISTLRNFYTRYLPSVRPNPNFPQVFLLDRSGNLIKHWFGRPDANELERLIQNAL